MAPVISTMSNFIKGGGGFAGPSGSRCLGMQTNNCPLMSHPEMLPLPFSPGSDPPVLHDKALCSPHYLLLAFVSSGIKGRQPPASSAGSRLQRREGGKEPSRSFRTTRNKKENAGDVRRTPGATSQPRVKHISLYIFPFPLI